jgi:hypothetical protein
MQKKRKPFDAAKQRLRGTEAAAYQRSAKTKEPRRVELIGGKPKYKVEHENLIAGMRAARRMAAYEESAARGKARGPPPPMPVMQDVPDGRIECPTCHKKFGPEQYERHAKNGYCSANAVGMAPRAAPRRLPARGPPARGPPGRPALGRR